MLKIFVPLAEGFEEIEAVTIIDILRRAGAEVVVGGVETEVVEGSHGIPIKTDQLLENVNPDDFDMIALPGGMPGMVNLKRSEKIIEFIRTLNNSGKYIAAICAAPVVLAEAGVTKNRTITSHPAHAKLIQNVKHTGGRVEVDNTIITGQAAGSAMEFAFKLVEILFGKEKVEEVNQTVLARL